ncbi:MAG: cob(I)yrinic acid a,c-diamide adenosyltransferase [Spirochaetes bacterium]|nr:cob(I)yrinic acid a,c-diamide adenosyltransferase [Spirochaetota bacterium]
MGSVSEEYLCTVSIMTKTGDDGSTGLWSGERIEKDVPRVEAYGTIDELSSLLGAACHLCHQDEVILAIEDIQRTLFRVGGELASLGTPFDRPILDEDEALIAEKTAAIEESIQLCGFVLPGMTQGSAALDVARTVARRAERRIISLSRDQVVSLCLRRYINRLSDYLFMLARAEEKAFGKMRYV